MASADADLRRRKMVPFKSSDQSRPLLPVTDPSERNDVIEEEGESESRFGVEGTTDLSPLIDRPDDDGGGGGPSVEFRVKEETSLTIGVQVFLPYMIAGLGMVAAGIVLDIVQHWNVFREVSEVFILVPALLGLKGNLEMTLASRLSTQANLGNMDSTRQKWLMVSGNMALIQLQAIVVGSLAAVAAMVFGWIPEGKFNLEHGLLLCASSVSTAAVASFVLGAIMVVVVLVSRRFNINPDNVATPIAASLGDLITLSLLAAVSSYLYKCLGTHVWVAPCILGLFVAMIPLWCCVSHFNHYTKDVLYTGWTPVISAMVISSVGGLILDFTVANYYGIAVFQPVINGVGGNLVAVQSSRISTALHMSGVPVGKLPEQSVNGCPNACSTFFGSDSNARTARVLLAMVIPGHLIFIYTIYYMNGGHTSITWIFTVFYLIAALLQVILLLYIANWLVHRLWLSGDDPDNYSIPYLTAIGDLLGTALLAAAFHLLFLIGDRDADVGD